MHAAQHYARALAEVIDARKCLSRVSAAAVAAWQSHDPAPRHVVDVEQAHTAALDALAELRDALHAAQAAAATPGETHRTTIG